MKKHVLLFLVLLGLPGPGIRAAIAAAPNGGPDTSTVQTGDPARRLQDRILYTADPRRDEVEFNSDSGIVGLTQTLDNQDLGWGSRMTLREYSRYLTLEDLGDALHRRVYSDLAAAGEPGVTASITPGNFRVEVPITMPGPLRSVFGTARPNLALTGSETLTLGGTSNWDNRPASFGRQSKFPQLEMKQDLQVRVQGNIGVKVKVDVDQSSNAAQTSLANRIRIVYQGDEDEVVQKFELGNTDLSLPGTQFVSYSGQHQGLFGLKTVNKFGPLDLTVIASKQEGQSSRDTFKLTAQQTSERIDDYSFVKGTFFYLNLKDENVDRTSIEVFVDQRVPTTTNYGNTQLGLAELDPLDPLADTSLAYRGNFEKKYNDFYQVHSGDWPISSPTRPIIELTAPLDPGAVLAVRYKLLNGTSVGGQGGGYIFLKMIRPYADLLTTNALGLGDLDAANYWYPTTFYESKNVYRLSGSQIDPTKFTLKIYTTTSNPPADYLSDASGNPIGKLVEITGIDNQVLNGSSYTSGPQGHGDGLIDQDTGNRRNFVDYARGLIFFPDPRPFHAQPDTQLTNAVPGFLQTPTLAITRPGAITSDNSDDPIYTRKTYDPNLLANHYYLEAQYSTLQAPDVIKLNRTDILPGSEVVTINGQRLTRDVDYSISPDIGEIRILKPDLLVGFHDISVDYAYAPLFAAGQKALVGFSGAYGAGGPRSIATTWLFENTSTADLRPKLGDEPSRTIVGDLNAQGRWTPKFLTRAVDAIPGVRTAAESNVNLQGEVALSLPNPNTKNAAYIDDMEGVRDVTSVDLSFGSWKFSSLPPAPVANDVGLVNTLSTSSFDTKTHWFNPTSRVVEGDLNPALPSVEYQQIHRVLELKFDQDPSDPNPDDKDMWGGIQQGIARSGQDLSTVTNLEMWVNEQPEIQRGIAVGASQWPHGARLHIDFGRVNEDEMWTPNKPPNGQLDTENPVPSLWNATLDDNGLDSIPDSRETGPYSDSTADPGGDDYHDIPNVDRSNELANSNYWANYMGINGTEKNLRFDSEDLDGNALLDTDERYFEYSISLDSLEMSDDKGNPLIDPLHAPFVVQRGYWGSALDYSTQNGWKLLRIPITAFVSSSQFGRSGSPDWHDIKHVRVWVSGAESGNRLSIGQMDLVGNRWEISPTLAANNTPGFRVTTVDNKDNSNYTLPPGVDAGVTQVGAGTVAGREQSLSLEVNALQPDSSVSAVRLFQLGNSDWTLYRSVQFFLRKGDQLSTRGLRFFIRMGNEDTTSYYEYSTPVPMDWVLKTVPFDSLTLLKPLVNTGRDTTVVHQSADGEDRFVVRKQPSFNSIRRIEIGLYNPEDSGGYVGQGAVWVDELTLGNVRKTVGTASRFSLDMNLADFATVGFNVVHTGADFLSIGQNTGSGLNRTTTNFNTEVRLGKFLEPEGVSLPVRLSVSQDNSVPLFQTGSDVLFNNTLRQAQQTQSSTFALSTSLSRTATNSPWLLRYFLNPWAVNAGVSETKVDAPAAFDYNRNFQANLAYNLPTTTKRFSLKVPVLGLKFYPLPSGFSMSQNLTQNNTEHADRSLANRDSVTLFRDPPAVRQAAMNVTTSIAPLDNLSFSVSSGRDLTLKDDDGNHKKFGPINLGREVLRTYSLSFSQNVKVKGFGPRLDYAANSNNARPPDLSSSLLLHNLSNQGTLTMTMDVPMAKIAPHARAPKDSSGWNPVRSARTLLSSVGSINGSYNVTRNNQTSQALAQEPFGALGLPLGYILGFSDQPGSFVPQTQGNSASSTSRHGTVQNSFRLGQMQFDTRYDETQTEGHSTSAPPSGTRALTWPDLRVNMSNLERVVLPLKKLLSGVTVTSNYNRQRRTQYSANGGVLQTALETESKNWQPLLTLSGELPNHDRLSVGAERTDALSTNAQAGGSQENATKTYRFSLKHTIHRPNSVAAAPAGQSMGFHLKGDVEVSIDGTLTSQVQSVSQLAGDTQVSQNVTHLDVGATASYNFVNNVHGNMNAGFTRNNDKQLGVISHSIRLQATAGISF